MRIGVDKTTVFNWEAGTASPNLRAMPGVIAFLSYNPVKPGATPGEQLRAARRRLGLSHRDLADRLGVDPSTVRGWESGRHQPSRRLQKKVRWFTRE